MAGKKQFSRRDFLASSTKAAAAVSVASMFAPRTAAAAKRTIGANDRITLGLIGSGGQGTHDTAVCCKADNVVCTAVCDVAEFRMEWAEIVLQNQMKGKGHQGIKIDRYGDYRKLLDRKDLDGVVIATPDLWHYKPFMAAVDAGLHIYQEKPFSYTIEQGLEMVRKARSKPDLVIQIGTQRRSRTNYVEAKKLIDEGKLGEIGFVRAYDCRNYISAPDPFLPKAIAGRYHSATKKNIDWDKAKIDWDQFQEPCTNKVAFDPVRYTAWRWFWEYAGGLVTDVGVHVVDNVHYLLSEPTPRSAVCNGGVYGVKYWETPDVVNAVWDYGDFSMTFTGNFTNGWEGDGFMLYGADATMEVRGNHVKVWAKGKRDKPIHEFPSAGPSHQRTWINALRGQGKVTAPVELGHSSLLPPHMANLAYRRGTMVTWNPATHKLS